MKFFFTLLCLCLVLLHVKGKRVTTRIIQKGELSRKRDLITVIARRSDFGIHSDPFSDDPTSSSRKFNIQPNYTPRSVNDFKDRDSRLGFIRKVYAIFGVQMFTTIAITYQIMNNAGLAGLLFENYATVSLISLIGSTGVVLALLLSEKLRHRPPYNFILLGIHAVLQSLMVGTFSTLVSPRSVFLGTIHTLAAFMAITLYSFQPNPQFDLSVAGNTLLACLSSLTVGSLLGLFNNMPVFDNLISGALAVMFAVYLFHDTQKIVGGKHHKYQYGQKEYILAALNLYEDALMLYLKIVEILDKAEHKRKK